MVNLARLSVVMPNTAATDCTEPVRTITSQCTHEPTHATVTNPTAGDGQPAKSIIQYKYERLATCGVSE